MSEWAATAHEQNNDDDDDGKSVSERVEKADACSCRAGDGCTFNAARVGAPFCSGWSRSTFF